MRRLIRKWRRRRPGVYAYRARKHNRTWRHWAYVGESFNPKLRDKCHAGRCVHGKRECPEQNWYDLDPVQYVIISLPWWLGWKWILKPLETLVILTLWPRYNVSKNRWNPLRIPPYLAALQRTQRERQRLNWR